MAVSAEQKKKDDRRKRKAAAEKEKKRLAKVPPRYGGTAAPKPYKEPSKRAKKRGQREIMSGEGINESRENIGRDLNPFDIGTFIAGRDTRNKWDVGRGGKPGQLRGGDIPLRTAESTEERARANPARGAHRGQSVGSRWDYDYKQGGNVAEAEAFFTEQTTPNFVNRNKLAAGGWVDETATPDAKIVKKKK